MKRLIFLATVKMSDSAESENDILAKAEARRRRILENSKARLEKISSKKQDDGETPYTTHTTKKKKTIRGQIVPIKANFTFSTDETVKAVPKNRIIYPDPEVERVEYESYTNFSPYNDLNSSPQSMFEILNRMQQQQQSQQTSGNLFTASASNSLNGGPNLFAGAASFTGGAAASTPLPDTRFIRMLKMKLHISVLAFVTYTLIVTNSMFTSNVFIIFLLWEMAEVFLLKTYETNQPSFLGILFVLSGIPAIHSTIIIKLFETFNKILKDVAIFVFFFVISHVLWNLCYTGEALTVLTSSDHIL